MSPAASQIALPLKLAGSDGPARIVLGDANQAVAEALAAPKTWPFRTALLAGPPRSGKSLFARWFAESGAGEAIDDAGTIDETTLFHRWNRAQEHSKPLLLVADAQGWEIALPDLKSRIGAALQLEIGVPDDALVPGLIESHAAQRGLALGEGALAYLAPRSERSWAGIERLVAAIDRLSLERKVPATMSIWRDAIEAVQGAEQPRLL
ncbi:MAG TPA: ATPase [Croceibacterium sp.]|nr:ATPase [Croceibacterium sp.]